MGKLKSSEAKCKICEKIYSLTTGDAYSADFCHVRCLNQARRNREEKKKEEIRKAKQVELALNPIFCLHCKDKFEKKFHTEKYCSVMCREKKYQEDREIKKKAEDEKPKKKKLSSHEINQRLNYARVSKNQGPSLKQYKSVRG